MKRIAVFASGSGTNAQNIIEYFRDNDRVEVSIILSNKKNAKVLDRAKNFNVPTMVFNRDEFYNNTIVLDALKKNNIDLVVLAGFLWLMPKYLTKAYPNRIINIHPALLPNYGGKGMYGMNVHQAVLESGEKESGITIHYVNEHYDEGAIIFQAKCNIEDVKTADEIAEKIHSLEYEYFPKVIERVLNQ